MMFAKSNREVMARAACAVVIAAAAFSVFLPALGGDFVYDDKRQVVRNLLIQEPALYWKALSSDVWAFKGDGRVAASNYWRPTFTAWSILNFRFFGAEPFGWHFTNLLLHALVSVLCFFLLLRWRFSLTAAFASALLFAVHPIHTESVAWIAGSPDLLLSAFLLGALLASADFFESGKWVPLAIALVFYSLALGSKEIAMVCFPLFGLAFLSEQTKEGTRNAIREAVYFSIPFFGLAVAFFFLRWFVLGEIHRAVAGAPSIWEAILSVPAVFDFYIVEAISPVGLTINHSLRPVTDPGMYYFVIPVLVDVSIFAIFWRFRKWCPSPWPAIGIVILPLLPVLNVAAFHREQIVHDRYLYLPLLGLLALLVPAGETLFRRLFQPRSAPVFIAVVLVIVLILGFRSFSYSEVWTSEISLWEHAVAVDPESSTNLAQYGAALESAKRYPEAAKTFKRSIEIEPSARGYLGWGRAELALGKYEEATEALQKVIGKTDFRVDEYTLYQAYEALAVAYVSEGKSDEARSALEEASQKLPLYRAAIASKLAVVLYQQGKKDEALKVLEAVRKKAGTELLPESKSAIFRLGSLYAEMGKRDAAVSALGEYLRLTAGLQDENTRADRKRAEAALLKLR